MQNIEVINMPFGSLKIYRKDCNLCTGVIASGMYNCTFSKREYNVYIGYDFDNIDNTYRAVQMQKGVYLGHNIGEPCKLHIDNNKLYLYCHKSKEYEKIFWSFVLKYILTVISLEEGVLHIKGLLLKAPEGKLFLMLGKGKSGKTTLGKMLEKYGYQVISNTHCLVKGNYIWGVNSWVRIRNAQNQDYIRPKRICFPLDGEIEKCYIIDWNAQGLIKQYDNINMEEKYIYIKNFVAAICNYDLKEEIWDYMARNDQVKERLAFFYKEDLLVKEFVKRDIEIISLDARDEKCLNKFIHMMNN
jgi:hypothetical protein